MFLRLALAALLALGSLPAAAATLKITYSGTVSDVTVTAGDPNVLQTKDQAFTISYLYDLSQGSRQTEAGLDSLFGIAPGADLALPWTDAKLGSLAYAYAPRSGYTLVQGAPNTPGFVSSTKHIFDISGARILTSASVFALGAGPATVRLDQTGTWAVDPALSTGQVTFALVTLATNEAQISYSFSLAPRSVTVENLTPVPLPASGLLLAGALLALRRRRR